MKVATKAILAYAIMKARKKRNRTLYIRPIFENRKKGESLLVSELKSDPFYHHRYFRMDKSTFDTLYTLLEKEISREACHRVPISPLERLAVTLRYLATGNSQVSLAMNYRISPSSVSIIVREVMEAICKSLKDEMLPFPTETLWKKVAEGYQEKWNFPNCIGAIDGKHIQMKCPPESGSSYYNYKNYFSVVLFAIVDADYKFTVVDIGAEGSKSDGGILRDSTFGKLLEENKLNIPKSKRLGEQGPVPHVILGDDGFPLKCTLMKPYPGKYLPNEEKIFNYRLSRARRTVENAFGILAARWRIFNSCIDGDVSLVNLIIKTTVILHNYMITKKDCAVLSGDYDENDDSASTRRNTNMTLGMASLEQQGSNNYPQEAFDVREKFKMHFNFEDDGTVSWQNEYAF